MENELEDSPTATVNGQASLSSPGQPEPLPAARRQGVNLEPLLVLGEVDPGGPGDPGQGRRTPCFAERMLRCARSPSCRDARRAQDVVWSPAPKRVRVPGLRRLKVLLRAAGSGQGKPEPRREASAACLDRSWFPDHHGATDARNYKIASAMWRYHVVP